MGDRRARAAHPDAVFVAYVNTPAAVKAMADICCTSSNAAAVVASIPKDREIVFLPDGNLGSFAEEQTGRRMICWRGGCPTHMGLTEAEIAAARAAYPGAPVLMHPECRPPVRALADYVGSTTGIVKYAMESEAEDFIIATEEGVLYELAERCPGKRFHLASRHLLCVNMKKTTLEKVRDALKTLEPRVVVPEKIREKAVTALTRMLHIAPAKKQA